MANILVIEDDEDLRLTLIKLLQSTGNTVYAEPDGSNALKLCEEIAIDLMITDIFMPEKDGLETVMELKQSFPHIKIIAISGGGRLGTTEFLDYSKKFGVDETLVKPVDIDVLLNIINHLLNSGEGV